MLKERNMCYTIPILPFLLALQKDLYSINYIYFLPNNHNKNSEILFRLAVWHYNYLHLIRVGIKLLFSSKTIIEL